MSTRNLLYSSPSPSLTSPSVSPFPSKIPEVFLNYYCYMYTCMCFHHETMLVTWDCTAYVGAHPCGKPIPPLLPSLTACNTLLRMGPWDFPLSTLAFPLLLRGKRCLYDPSIEISCVQLPRHIQEAGVLGLCSYSLPILSSKIFPLH